ncbi:glycosyltransferase [Mesorhizobium sp. M00.F.Ca.ET.216.01.1.1]|uniref:glycosyltransferase n=1 Tax=Mesorhizobium sp. M00.F.Ca.ET.216.01.1.1 TaxID=2500528 RepID=UPI000FD72F41|nr:glycosyltransferase [Mesorhizobium sp. M00.F.Ca.ET.216.01.1.1]TGQ42052.1 glycosyltransferase [Mesorhizobium sp. M00.F.Ca.ET.216.01.1.1]
MAKRIVFHIASLRGGGAERVFVLMANELASRGHDVTLFTWNAEGPNAALLSTAVHLVDFGLPLRGEGYGKWATLKGIVRSARLFNRLGPHAVYSAPEFANLIVALALSLARSRARFFPSFHAAASLPSGSLGARMAVWLSAPVAARTTKAIAVSAGVGRDIVARGFPQSKVVVINNPLPPAAISQEHSYAWQAKLATMGGGPVIATAGRLVPVKDHWTLLRAFAVLRTGRRARLVIFGEGPLAAELRSYAEQSGIGADVLFAGYVNDPAACYAAADLFVLSSTSEGFGNVLVEALAAGVPVVSTDAPHGPREILDEGRFGALVPVGDVATLAKAMAEMLDRPTSAAVLKSRAADFEVEKIGDRYEALLAASA